MKKYTVKYEYISKKTGNVSSSGSFTVEANDSYDAEEKALYELKRHPRVQGTEGYEIEVCVCDY